MTGMLKNWTVRAKVIGAFACVFAATLCLGLFAMQRLSTVQENAVEFRDDWTPGIRAIGELKFVSMRLRQRQAVYLMLSGQPAWDKEQANLDKLKNQFEAVYAKFAVKEGNGDERARVAEVRADWDGYIALQPEMFKVLRDQGLAAGNAYYIGAAKHAYDKLQKVLEDYAAFHDDGAAESGTRGQEAYESARLWILVAMALAALLALGAGFVLVRSVSKPLGTMTDAMDELAKGNLGVCIPHSDQGDEIGRLAVSMAAFKGQLAAAERSKAEQTTVIVDSIGAGLSRLAEGDVTHRVTADLTGAFAKLKHDFNTTAGRLQETLKGVLQSTHQIAGGASEISQASDDLSRRTEQQAASLEETAAALEEITTLVKSAASNAQGASVAIGTTKAVAEEGGQVVETAVKAMDAIAQSSRQVTDIIGVIDEIAFQTNLLALNAGVEAARAGDAGRGFAVVASEVRALAQRSSEAAKQIKSLINASSEHVGEGVKLVGESGQVLKRIIEQVAVINGLARDSVQAGEQQASGIEEVNTAVASMDQATQQNAAMVEQATAAARNLASETERLQHLVAFFQVGAGTQANAPRAVPPPRAVVTPMRPAAKAVAGSRRVTSADSWTEF